MKLQIVNSSKDTTITLELKETGPGNIVLEASNSKSSRVLLQFFADGSVTRTSYANIGDFKFDSDGRIEIE